MRKLIICVVVIFIGIISKAPAKVTLNIYESDGQTLFNNSQNIRVGTELKLIVSSDANDFWSGGLFLDGTDRELAVLSGNGYDPNSRDYWNCHLIEAGPDAWVTRWEDSIIEGFDLFSGSDCNSGDWFEIDYTALAPGDTKIGFYEYSNSWEEPNSIITIHQVPTADFNTDGIVNLQDYSLLAYNWLEDDCTELNNCDIADIDSDGTIGLNDVILFSDYWLWGVQEPNEPIVTEPPADPNLVYSIVDANGLNEITIDIGETVTLYVDMTTNDVNDIWAFEVEADISDPNLGTIDNTAYDPNNPPGDGTARILASPNRWTFFDRWGSGYQQEDGIFLSGICYSGAFEDGHLASFEFTCQATGDIELTLLNRDTLNTSGEKQYPTLHGVLIHQNDPMATQSMMSTEMTTTAVTEIQEPTLTPEEMIQALEEIWNTNDGIQEIISEKDWKEFIKDIEKSY